MTRCEQPPGHRIFRMHVYRMQFGGSRAGRRSWHCGLIHSAWHHVYKPNITKLCCCEIERGKYTIAKSRRVREQPAPGGTFRLIFMNKHLNTRCYILISIPWQRCGARPPTAVQGCVASATMRSGSHVARRDGLHEYMRVGSCLFVLGSGVPLLRLWMASETSCSFGVALETRIPALLCNRTWRYETISVRMGLFGNVLHSIGLTGCRRLRRGVERQPQIARS
jgi:hypothetical protein